MNKMNVSPKIIVALDYPDEKTALTFVKRVSPDLCALKVGKELFTAAGPQFVEKLVNLNFKIFLDLKFHDIPNTVAKACQVAAKLGVWMLNVHALGGKRMLTAAREAIDSLSKDKPLLIGVTILTSMNEDDLPQLGLSQNVQENVLRLAKLSQLAGLDGVVCSPMEIAAIRKMCGPEFCLVTPGIRPTNYNIEDDQRRIMTPQDAIQIGASYLVIGRPITTAADPSHELSIISSSLET